ncbi:MAG: DUF998 domain-containing protein [Thermoproteota archaeon]
MKYYRLIGVLGAVLAYPFIAFSIILTPWFNFYDNALSDLGNIAWNAPIAHLYNTGLVLSGLLVAFFSLLTFLKHHSWRYLSWSLLLMLTGIDLALIGIFPEDTGRIHGLVSVMFFTMMILVMFLHGFCSLIVKNYTTGILSFTLSIASAIVWMVKWGWKGVAIQETLTSLMATAWLLKVSLQPATR